MNTKIWVAICVFATLTFEVHARFYENDAGSECSRTGVNLNINRTGFIYSPGFQNGSYPPLAKCYWSLTGPADKYIELSFASIDLEKHIGCGSDYVILSSAEGDITACGNEIPPRFLALGSKNVEVAFSSNKEVNLRGFKLQYRLIDAVCPSDCFTCKNLQCVLKTQVCNSVDDCLDGSDEEFCDQRTVPPAICGSPSIIPVEGNDDRIVGGREALPDSWPWQVSIQHLDVYPSGHFCGGALLNNLWIVTAAHCFRDLYRRSSIRVVLGRYNTFERKMGESIRYIESIHLHPNYGTDGKDDIALAKLNAEVSFSQSISPVCLPDVDEKLVDGDYVYVTGWGETRVKEFSGALKQAMLPVANREECVKAHFSFREVGKNCFCTGFKDQVHSSCVGDSGGPVVHSKDGKWILSGVVSWGSESCSYLAGPSVNTDISSYVEWIMSVMN